MSFEEQLKSLAEKIEDNSALIENEEVTKNAFVLPFLQILGYDPFNPQEVFPEYTADVGSKKGEKVDYAIMQGGEPVMLIECKSCNSDLNDCNAAQLRRYFQVTSTARIGILTNGKIYQFYTDIDSQNLMDKRPFMIFDFKTLEESLIPELQKLSKSRFDLDKTLSAASELKYTRAIKKLFAQEAQNPSEEFMRLFASKVYSGKLMPTVKAKFTELVKKAINLHINESINDRLKYAMVEDDTPEPAVEDPAEEKAKSKIITTDDERDGYFIIKSILREVVSPERIIMRDTQSYCGVLLDDNNRKPLCRLRFNGKQYYLGLIVDENKTEEKMPLESLDDIFKYGEQLKTTISYYE